MQMRRLAPVFEFLRAFNSEKAATGAAFMEVQTPCV